jgi:chitin synthase
LQFSAFFLAFKAVESVKQQPDFDPTALFKSKIFTNVVISLVATLGLYIFASLIFVSWPPPYNWT